MPPREWGFRIDDILEAIERIERYTADFDFAHWLNDEKTIDAVVRNLEIIGEAAAHVPDEVRKQYDDVPWDEMRGIRNILAHEYFAVDHEILWRTIKRDLGSLKTILQEQFGN